MSSGTITVYANSSNRQTIRLLESGFPADLRDVERMTLRLSNGMYVDSDQEPQVFDWETDAIDGKVHLQLGRLGHNPWWVTTIYNADLVVYDELYDIGIFWGFLRIKAIAN